MEPIMLARVAHVLAFTDVAHAIGAPVKRELQKAGLPCLLDSQPDAYVPVRPALRFFRRIERKEGIDDIGFLAARRETFDRLSGSFTSTFRNAPTLFDLLCKFCELAPLESTNCRVSLAREGENTRIVTNLVCPPDLDGLHYSEWIQIVVIVEIIRKVVGPTWCPSEIAFRSRFTPCESAFEEFPNTGFLFGQEDTSLRVPTSLMIQPLRGLRGGQERYGALTGERQSPASNGLDFPGSLKLTLRSYLPEGYPDVTLAAEIAGSSVRTLQRRLMPFGLSYSHLIQQVRFEVASEMLEDSNVRMLDVARAVGYEDQSHFTRAFRRIAGVTPTEYRRQRETG